MTSGRLRASPIEDYLDELTTSLRREPQRRVRHLVSEAEAHLYDAATELTVAGATQLDAEAEAVRRFGDAHDIARAEARSLRPLSTVIGQVALSGLFLASIGAVAVGVSGLIAGMIRVVGGTGSIVDLSSGPALTPANCARWLSLNPSAGSCRAAALGDWANETVFYRIALGVVGIFGLVAFHFVRQVARKRNVGLLPRPISDTIAASIFGIAGIWTLGLGIDSSVLHIASGQWFSAAVTAVALGTFFGLRLLRRLRELGSVASTAVM